MQVSQWPERPGFHERGWLGDRVMRDMRSKFCRDTVTPEEALTSLLASLRAWADAGGVDFDKCVAQVVPDEQGVQTPITLQWATRDSAVPPDLYWGRIVLAVIHESAAYEGGFEVYLPAQAKTLEASEFLGRAWTLKETAETAEIAVTSWFRTWTSAAIECKSGDLF